MEDPTKTEWTQHPTTIIAIVLSLAIQFGAIIWFASALSTRVEKIEGEVRSLEIRYNSEVIPRIDLTQRLDSIDRALNRNLDGIDKLTHTIKQY